jgi:hypothetical protein
MTPHHLLGELKKEGVVLKVRDGQVCGPRNMTQAQRKCVSDNKIGLLIALTYTCPTCNQSVRMYERPGYWSLECGLDPTHYSEVVTKREGQGLGFLAKHDADCPCTYPAGYDPELGF